MTADTEKKWHVAALPALSVGLALLVQTVAVVWWAASMNARVEEMETRQESTAAQVQTLSIQQATAATAAARVEEKLTAQAAVLARIERLLEQRYAE